MGTVLNFTIEFVHELNDLVADSQILVESLAAVVSTLTKIAGLIGQAVDFMASLVSNLSANASGPM